MPNVSRLIVVACATLLAACGGSDATATDQVDVAGKWKATIGPCLGGNQTACAMTWTLSQSGVNVTGTGTLADGAQAAIGSMTIIGTVTSGNAITLSLAGSAFDADPDHTVQFAGTRTNASTINGTFSSTGSITGAFAFTKQ